MAEALVLIVFPALLALAAGWDVASYTIPNFLQVAFVATFAVFVAVTAMPLAVIGSHLLAGSLGLAVGSRSLRSA